MNRGVGGDNKRGQSSTIGVVLIFAVVIAGASIVVTIGGSGLLDVQSQSEVERAENSMTLFDSRAAMVALGDSDVQGVTLGQDSGTVRIEENTGWMRITHTNYTDDPAIDNETIYNESLGKVVYQNGDRKLAYQGGGVWRLDEGASAQMISPPEFHYRGATLTLPVIRTFGSGQASGTVNVNIKPREQARKVFPNRTTKGDGNEVGSPFNSTGSIDAWNYTNPIRNGTVSITVKSEFADGWLHYFEERTTGTTEKLGPDTVKLTLETTTGAPGDFQMPPAGDSVLAGSIAGGHPLTEFDVTLDIDKTDPHFSFYAEENGKEFELHVFTDANKNACQNGNYGDVYISTYFYDDDGSKTYESWETDALDPNSTDGLEWECTASNGLQLTVNFLEDHTMTYDQIGSDGNLDPGTDDPSCGTSTGVTRGNKYAYHDRMKDCDSEGWSLRSPSTWDQHEEVAYENPGATYNQGNTQTMDQVVDHYLSAMESEVALIAKDGPGNSDGISEPDSFGTLLYETAAGSQYVTYLHITENEILVDAS